MRLIFVLFAVLISPAAVADDDAKAPSISLTLQRAVPQETSTPAPQWYLDDIEFLTRDGGRWVTSNAEYQNENEPVEAYVLEWKKGYANSMTGRLFGILDGKETGDYWRFRQYWHGGEGKAVLEQFGFGGAIGVGVLWREGDRTKTVQTFYPPQSAPALQGHIAYNPGPETHVTESYNIVDGEWRLNRTYTWKLEKAPDEG